MSTPLFHLAVTNRFKTILIAVLLTLVWVGWYHQTKPLPKGLHFSGWPQPAFDVKFLGDVTYLDDAGISKSQQTIFNEMLAMIGRARHFILLDKFLFNAYLGSSPKAPFRPLSAELTEALLAQKRLYPSLRIVFITDPVNSIYGAIPEPNLEKLKAGGGEIIFTKLACLRDSNPIYSSWFRIFLAPFGTAPGNLLPNPLGKGRTSLRSYFQLFNFKANHRKVLICDEGESFRALITSANPHDGSSAHDNVALSFSGPGVWDALQAELAVLKFSGGAAIPIAGKLTHQNSHLKIRWVTEKAILNAVIAQIDSLEEGERLEMIMFYLSHRKIVHALKKAHDRGGKIQILLDANKDAFGRKKNGIPNRQTALELHRNGIAIRWANTQGEQCHAKMLLFRQKHRDTLILGSANLTRRNLDNYNLEANIVLSGKGTAKVFQDANAYFQQAWFNQNGRNISVPYAQFADTSMPKQFMYRIMESWGLSTF